MPEEHPPEEELRARREEAGRKLFAGPCDFVLGAAQLEQIPPHEMVEIALAGRSNVGKSSLVNALTGRKTLARTSNTPGRTQQLNFFDLGGRLMMADLPGYGYAKAPKPLVEQWQAVIFAYLRGRPQLRRAMVLIDARHGMKKNDAEVLDMLDKAAVNYQIVMTKADKIGPTTLERTTGEVRAAIAKRPAAHPEVLPTSSVTGLGVAELRGMLAALTDDALAG